MTKKQRVVLLQADVYSADWEVAKAASNRLFTFGGRFNKTGRRRNRRFLVAVLDQNEPQARRAVALTFRKQRYQLALPALLRAIKNPANLHQRSTMAYALENLNCSQRLAELFTILFGAIKNPLLQSSILNVLEEQIFEFSRTDLFTIEAQWNTIKSDWNRLNEINSVSPTEYTYDQAVIQNFVDGYMAYLED